MIGGVTLGTWVRLNNGFENDCTNEVKVVLFLSPDGCDITFVIDLNAWIYLHYSNLCPV